MKYTSNEFGGIRIIFYWSWCWPAFNFLNPGLADYFIRRALTPMNETTTTTTTTAAPVVATKLVADAKKKMEKKEKKQRKEVSSVCYNLPSPSCLLVSCHPSSFFLSPPPPPDDDIDPEEAEEG